MSPSPREFEPRMMATAIGSLPHGDASTAVELITGLFEEAPFWPQLPNVSPLEGMMAQYIEGLPGAAFDRESGKATLDIEAAVAGLEAVDSAYEKADAAAGAISSEFACGLAVLESRLPSLHPAIVKGHVTGPVTLALGLETSYEGRAAIYEPDLARMVARHLALKGKHQEQLFNRAAPGAATLIFYDEPSLASIGSAVLNLDAELAVELLSLSAAPCNGLVGVHCCGETDFGMLLEAGIDVVNFDGYSFLDSVTAAAKEVRRFLRAGGMLAIGVVPSFLPHPEAVADETADSLWPRLLAVLDTLAAEGLDREELARRSFVTPSCGTGGMRPELAERTLSLTVELSRRARAHFF